MVYPRLRRRRQVVTAVLALTAYAGRDPPYGGMVEEDDLDHALAHVHEVVAAPALALGVASTTAVTGGDVQ